MLSTKSISLNLLLFSLLVHVATSLEPLYHICFLEDNDNTNTNTNTTTTTAYSPYYRTNLNSLLHILSTRVPSTGFGRASVGQGQNRVNGLALCRGDVSISICKSCVTGAGKELLGSCPQDKGAIVWYDYCLLKYSNEDFFGEIDEANKFYMYNLNDVDYNPEWFNEKIKDLLSRLAHKASSSTKLYATGELELGESKTLYGLVQCTRDLKDVDCKTCLDDAISEIPGCCTGKRGGRVVGGSCNVRYELYPIVDA